MTIATILLVSFAVIGVGMGAAYIWSQRRTFEVD